MLRNGPSPESAIKETLTQGRTGSTLVVGVPHIVLGGCVPPEVVGPRAVPYCPYGQSAPALTYIGIDNHQWEESLLIKATIENE